MFHIMVVEDDANTRKLMCTVLKQGGYEPVPAKDGLEALDILDKKYIDLIVLDIMLPGMNGYDLTRTIRDSGSELPVLMVTAREAKADKITGFTSGTDDYMVKPINLDEMILRIGALLRRAKMASDHSLTVGSVTLDYDALTVSVGGNPPETIPNKEFMLLFKLLSYPNKIFTRRQLLDELWGLESEVDERTVDVHIKRLREKYTPNDDFDLITVRGLGYKAVKKV